MRKRYKKSGSLFLALMLTGILALGSQAQELAGEKEEMQEFTHEKLEMQTEERELETEITTEALPVSDDGVPESETEEEAEMDIQAKPSSRKTQRWRRKF